jgi:hypothetical protein
MTRKRAKSASREWSGTFRWPSNVRYNRLDDQEHGVKNTWRSMTRPTTGHRGNVG